MNETAQPARTNHHGHPCPPWCQTDHGQVHGVAGTFGFHGGPATRIEADGQTSLPDEIVTRAFHAGTPDWEPVVSVAAVRHRAGARDADPQVWLSPGDAEHLAAILGMIGDWDQLSRLAAAIRVAAAQVTEGSDGQD